jgi:hypothetical protein
MRIVADEKSELIQTVLQERQELAEAHEEWGRRRQAVAEQDNKCRRTPSEVRDLQKRIEAATGRIECVLDCP